MLIETLENKRADAGMTDDAFARQFGVSRSYWSLVRAGKRDVNTTFLSAVVKVYPDLAGHALIFLQQTEAGSQPSGDYSHRPHQTHQERQETASAAAAVDLVAPATTERKTPRPPTIGVGIAGSA